ncbi:hypothetical protein [Hymenobacter psychrotolerans]|uniref:Nucleotide-diphospho-sugar transferase n=1 Tax=Hymenobacter psychrotolerans DSM 18569 TaxID=1121959 RepID=A0A1M6RBT7_9BACT|nr:hypothetical protein [Hymenobacter psychrotolerans]SHK29921.1 hypothetical protein SAMN02746009_00658 [Hymenobacter psychrotolerans DSM 18569]
MNYIIYQAYGSPIVFTELLFSILSLLRVTPRTDEIRVLVYTDNPVAIEKVLGPDAPILYQLVAAAQWQEWRGIIDFVHRAKLKVLEHAAAHYPGNLLYVDTDTVFTQDSAQLFAQIEAGRPVFHVSEGTLRGGNVLNRKIYRRLRGQQFNANGRSFTVPADTMMYNAGMAGFRSRDAQVISDIIAVTEALYRYYPKHVMEQLAFSLELPKLGTVVEGEAYVVHYWNIKAEVRPMLEAFFAKYQGRPAKELANLTTRLDFAAASQSKLEYYSLAGWQRALRKLMGKQWQMPQMGI